MKVTSFTKDNLKILREVIQNSLNTVGEAYGLNIKMKEIRYSDYELHAPLEAEILDKHDDLRKDKFETYCPVCGLTPEDFGRIFTVAGKQYKIVDVKPSNRKYPVIAQRLSDGKSFKFPVSEVKRGEQK
jgi:hypothetical protein